MIHAALNGCVDAQNYLASLRKRASGFERLILDKFYPTNERAQ
jgi:hypothetical protein